MDHIFCTCDESQFDIKNHKSSFLGIDKTNGRFGEVEIFRCEKCENKWIKYFVEYESFTKSGRWFMGLLTDKIQKELTPENTISYLEDLERFYFGGSYFNSTGQWGNGKIFVDM